MTIFSKMQLDCEEIISKSLFPVLPLIQIPDWEQTQKYYSLNPSHKLNSLILSDNQIISDCRTLCTDILCNTKFDVLFSHHDVENYIDTDAVLEYISVNRSYEVELLPKGYTGFCIINFPNGKPELLKKLRPEKEYHDLTKYDKLYLTQSAVLERILNQLNV
jgi:hypothetical protein